MALDIKVDASAYNALPDAIKKEYVERDGSYHLDVRGLEDTGALKRAKDYEVNKRKELERTLAEKESKLSDLESKGFDIIKAKADWEAEQKKVLDGKDDRIKKLSDFGKKKLADDVALALAKEISTSPELLLPHISSRFVADLDSDTFTTKILDKEGKPSKLTLEELKAELLTETRFAPILIGSKARGGSAPLNSPSKGGSAPNPQEKVDVFKLSAAEMAARIDAKKAARK